MSAPLDYRSAGVDLEKADDAKGRIKAHVESTLTAGARGSFGGFGGMYRIPSGYRAPVLVSSADGVGTKLKVAIEAGVHDTVGRDLVNHCVNDILVMGAVPLYFLDYVAFGVLDPAAVEGIVAGVAHGCRENGCALLGGETAEMPGIYTPPDYDLAGFITGIMEEDAVLGADRVRDGDVLIGLASAGLHTNGYSLARKIVAEAMQLGVHDPFPGEDGATVAEVLLRPHLTYLPALRPVLSRVHGMAHITGGGLPGNVNRMLPAHLDAAIELDSWTIPNVYVQLQAAAQVGVREMFRTFNMGVGMVIAVAAEDVDAVRAAATAAGTPSWVLGAIRPGTGAVQLLPSAG
ncbi:MAG TPA: phosphoribosylformylglycinamidine cyclo-ligase [Gemmatimonadaceae bacterium]|nr:phosphoribosylformylglycinamidine cyclo-ligase [Gemmatimonadaceae bacterium]